jgi:hypothetical protein
VASALAERACLVALFCQQGGLQLGEGLGALLGVIRFQLLSQLADGGGELLGLDAQLPEGAGALEGTGRTRGSGAEAGAAAEGMG